MWRLEEKRIRSCENLVPAIPWCRYAIGPGTHYHVQATGANSHSEQSSRIRWELVSSYKSYSPLNQAAFCCFFPPKAHMERACQVLLKKRRVDWSTKWLYKEAPPVGRINSPHGHLPKNHTNSNLALQSQTNDEVPVDQAVPIGTKLQLRARISLQSVWKYVKLMEVTVSPDPDDPHSVGSVSLVRDGCRNRDFASIIPHQPARYLDRPNEVFLDFEAFLLSSMKERSTLWIHSQVSQFALPKAFNEKKSFEQIKACMDAADCQPDFCLDVFDPTGNPPKRKSTSAPHDIDLTWRILLNRSWTEEKSHRERQERDGVHEIQGEPAVHRLDAWRVEQRSEIQRLGGSVPKLCDDLWTPCWLVGAVDNHREITDANSC
jgi:hypothetical protein